MRGYSGDAQYEVQGLIRDSSHIEKFCYLELLLDSNDITFSFIFSDFKIEVKFNRLKLPDCDECELTHHVLRIVKGVRQSC